MKLTLEDLAIFGGSPAFSEPLHVGRPSIGDPQRLLNRITDILNKRWLTNDGPYVREFERSICEMLGVKHCIAMCNGTIALEIAIRATQLAGEVIVPSFTFVATAHALQWQGITPVFCDVQLGSHNIDPTQVERSITSRTTGILGVHLWGRPCDVEALSEIAHRHKLRLLFDAAHAFGCSYRGRMIGNFGDAEVFSFHATKFFNTFEGGAVVTNNDEVAEKARLMRNFGFADYDRVVSLGINGKMSEVAAAMGLTSLESLEGFIAANHENYGQYKQELAKIPGVSLLAYDESEKCNYQYIVIEMDASITHVNRDQLQEILSAENVLARRYFYPGCHRMEPYRSALPDAAQRLPHTESLAARVLCLPTGTALGSSEINRICQIIRMVAAHGHTLRERLLRQKSSVLADHEHRDT